MSLTAILGAITALSTIVGGIVYVFKYSAWALTKTAEQKKEDIDKKVSDEKIKVEQTGRPQS